MDNISSKLIKNQELNYQFNSELLEQKDCNISVDQHLNYWQDKLSGIPVLLELPTDYIRPSIPQNLHKVESFKLSASLIERSQALSQVSNTSLFVILLTVWVCLLYRYSEQEDLVIAAPAASLWLNGSTTQHTHFLPLRIQFEQNFSFTDLLEKVHQVVVETNLHADFYVEQLIQNIGINGFQVGFHVNEYSPEKVSRSSPPISREETTKPIDLMLCWECEPGNLSNLRSSVIYNSELFTSTTVIRMIGHFQTLLAEITKDPQQSIYCLPLLTDVERHQLLVEWTDTQVEYPRDACIHQLFQQQAAQTPDAIALVFEDQQLTYQELDQYSNHLADYLQKLGVTPDVLVGLCLARCPELIIALLAILKAGGAYLPLDPAYPSERLATIVNDAQCSVLLTQQKWLEHLPNSVKQQSQVISLDTDWEINHPLSTQPSSSVTAENLAYVMYTSGSTGVPKGVCIPHRGVVRLVKGANYADFGADQVFLHLAAIAFDASTLEVWGPLLNGGKLVLMPGTIPSLEALGEAIRKYQITTLWLTAGLFHLMVDEKLEELQPLKQLLAGGDVLSVPHVQKVLQELKDCQLINGYGPTENTTFTCCYPIERDVLITGTIPIGRPIANTQVYILDRHLQPVPIGIPGELYIGGDGLARGYLNQPDLTDERFIPNPFSSVSGDRLYQTGDRCRWQLNGTIEFLGRIDFQVKIRGFRIEIGEIEAVLNQHPSVQSAVIVAREDRPGDKRLIAYVTAQGENFSPNYTPKDLRRFLQEKLPNYMIPSAFVVLEQLPLNTNGKVDRKALPAPDNIRLDIDTGFVPPRNAIEEILVSIWADVLGMEVGIYDTFCELGGHSLHSTQIVSRVRDYFAVDLPVYAVLEASTIAELGVRVESAHQQQDTSVRLLPLQPVPHNHDLPLSLYQERIWLLQQKSGLSQIYNLPMAFELQGNLQISALEQAINNIIQRHESLRTTFPLVQGFPVQSIAPELSISIPIQQIQTGSDLQQLVNAEAQKSFNLTQDPPIRTLLLQLSPEEHLLIITIHHIVSDGWSLGIFIHELSILYEAYTQGYPSPFNPPSIQYNDFSLWHRQWLQQPEIYTPLMDYWIRQLADAPPLLELPTDRPRPQLQSFQGRILSLEISLDLTQQLKSLSQKSGSTLFMTLLAAFVILLNRYSNQEEIVVGSPVANRNRTEIESIIGCFSNIVPLRTNLAGNPSFLDLLKQIRQTALEGYNYQDFPVEQLLPTLRSTRDLSYSPWFQVVFNLLNVPMSDLQLTGLNIKQLPIEKGTAFFDLTVLMWETATGLEGTIEYNTALFDESTIQELIQHFQTLLQGIVANPEQPILTQPLSTEGLNFQSKVNGPTSSVSNLNRKIVKTTKSVPQDELELQLTKIWEKVLGVSSIDVDDNFFDLGGHSLLALRLFVEIDKTLGKNLPLATMFQVPTIKQLASVIRHTKTSDSSSSLNSLQFAAEDYQKLMAIAAGRQGQKPRLESLIVTLNYQGVKQPFFFCANGLDEALPLAKYLGIEQPVCFMESGCSIFLHKPTAENVQALAAYHIQDILALQPEGNYILGGFSFGCLVAYEIAKQLENQGKKVSILAILDFPGSEPILYYYITKIHPFIRRIRLFCKEVYKNILKKNKNNLDLPVINSQKLYIMQGYSGKIYLFLADELMSLHHKLIRLLFPLFGWNKQKVEQVYQLPGNHTNLLQEPHVQVLADRLTFLLSKRS